MHSIFILVLNSYHEKLTLITLLKSSGRDYCYLLHSVMGGYVCIFKES